MKPWLVGALAVALAGPGCVSWQHSSVGALSEPHPQRAKYQVWVQGRSHYLHAVRTTPDSLFGVPNFQDPDCAHCVVGFALAAVDSVRTQREDQTVGRNALWITLLAVSVLVVVGIAAAGAIPAN